MNLRHLSLLGAFFSVLSFPVGVVLIFVPMVLTLAFALLGVIMGLIALWGIKEKRFPCYIAIGLGVAGVIFWTFFIASAGWGRTVYG